MLNKKDDPKAPCLPFRNEEWDEQRRCAGFIPRMRTFCRTCRTIRTWDPGHRFRTFESSLSQSAPLPGRPSTMLKLNPQRFLSLVSSTSLVALGLFGLSACSDSRSGGVEAMGSGGDMSSKSSAKKKGDDDEDDSGEGEDSAEDSNGDDGDKEDSGKKKKKDDVTTELTYYKDAKPIIDAKCANCHKPEDIAPFSLESYDEVYKSRVLVKHSIESGSMPPWSPREGCWDYKASRALTTKQKKVLLDWLDGGAPKGDPSEEREKSEDHGHDIEFNMTLEMPEPYTPQALDDNRCFLVDWPGKKTRYMTAFSVEPGKPQMLHHLLVYKASASAASKFRGFDSAEPGPGYTCLGGPGPFVHPNEVQLIGDWVPGQALHPFPEGVGIRFEPGDLIIFQHHYNTSFSGKLTDKSKYHFEFVDEVERPAAGSLYFNMQWLVPGLMPIPPGQKDVKHEYTFSVRETLTKLALDNNIGISPNDPLEIHFAGPHLHQLGQSAKLTLLRANGEKQCMVDIPKWDFDWQGVYNLKEGFIVHPEDRIHLECHFDNTAENQPLTPEGKKPAPKMVGWGDGTRDEMCLAVFTVTAVK